MSLFRKKKKPLFGSAIQPDCSCCRRGTDGGCSLNLEIDEDGGCPRFSYDPLLRTPHSLPPLREYSEEDFQL